MSYTEVDADSDIETLFDTDKFGTKFIRFDRKPPEELEKYYANNYNINTNCHHSCVTCQITHIKKYKNDLQLEYDQLASKKEKKEYKWFQVPCNYIPKGVPSQFEAVYKQLLEKGIPAPRAKRMMLMSFDQVAWSEIMFGFDDDTQKDPDISTHWYLRWYQKHSLRCSSKRMVLRQGRRSGKSSIICLKLINYALNYKVPHARDSEGNVIYRGPKIAIVTPFKSQLSVIFEELSKYLVLNTDLVELVETSSDKLYRQTPPLRMTFKGNGKAPGAVIEGFVSGATNKDDGSAGGSIRGISGDIIFADEMDMMPDKVFKDVINPLLMSTPNTILLASSTPIGKKGVFYQKCLESIDTKEVYFPSTVLPHWNSLEKETLRISTKDGFRAEYLAHFITDSYGVFKSPHVQAARANYSYKETFSKDFWRSMGTYMDHFTIAIGIDWNKNVGTKYRVVAWDPLKGRFRSLDAVTLAPSEYSNHAYMDKVKELNYKWKPKYIVPDEGYGHTIIENLILESHNIAAKPDKSEYEQSIARIKDIMVPINFSSNLQLYNPATGTYFDKYAKSFLVENAVQIFEREIIDIAEDDNDLIRQLGNYIIVEKKENGKLIYGQENEEIGDHDLDSFMLALGGIVMKESVFSYDLNNDVQPKTYSLEELPPTVENEEEALKEQLKISNMFKSYGNKDNIIPILNQKVRETFNYQNREEVTPKGKFGSLGVEYSEDHKPWMDYDYTERPKVIKPIKRTIRSRGW